MREPLLLSNSTAPGMRFLAHATEAIKAVMGDRGSLLFVPFASSDPDTYTGVMRQALAPAGIEVTGVHQARDLTAAAADAQAVFVGGGNSFRLLRTLTTLGVLEPLRQAAQASVPYLAASAGANLAGPAIRTTNDMPIAEPGSLAALGLIPFQLNPHYLDPGPRSPHQGETRPARIEEFLEENDVPSWACAKAPGCRSLAPGHTCRAATPAACSAGLPAHRHPGRRGPVRPAQHRPRLRHRHHGLGREQALPWPPLWPSQAGPGLVRQRSADPCSTRHLVRDSL